MSDEYILELKDIVKLFPGVRALDGMAIKIRLGAVHVICGENGAGTFCCLSRNPAEVCRCRAGSVRSHVGRYGVQTSPIPLIDIISLQRYNFCMEVTC